MKTPTITTAATTTTSRVKTHAIICCKNENFHHFYYWPAFCCRHSFVRCAAEAFFFVSIKFHLNANEKLPEMCFDFNYITSNFCFGGKLVKSCCSIWRDFRFTRQANRQSERQLQRPQICLLFSFVCPFILYSFAFGCAHPFLSYSLCLRQLSRFIMRSLTRAALCHKFSLLC